MGLRHQDNCSSKTSKTNHNTAKSYHFKFILLHDNYQCYINHKMNEISDI